MLDEDLRIASRTAASRAWLDALLPPEPDQKAIPASVYNVACQLLAVEQGLDAHPAFACMHLADGLWLAIRAARLVRPASRRPGRNDRGHDRGGVRIGAARAIRPRIRLSARQDEVLGLLATGCDTRSMARQMSLSESTIQDHLKSIFARTAAHDRVAVLSRALGTRS
jgi:DNA-binding NarL/FixJ family response regulator